MRNLIFVFLLLSQFIAACQQLPDNALSMVIDGPAAAAQSENPQAAPANMVFKLSDDGTSWQNISTGLSADYPIDYFLTHEGEAIAGTAEGVYRSAMVAASPVWEMDALLPEQVNRMYSSRTGLYVQTATNRFFRYVTGDIWIPAFSSPENRRCLTMMETADGALFTGTDKGVFKSADQGKTWRQVYQQGWVLKIVESNGVLLCTNEQGILRSADGGEHWEVVISEGGVGIAVEEIDGGFAAITYNTTSASRRIRISTDAGKTWQAIDKGLPPHANIASIVQLGGNFFCGHPAGIYRSADRGKTWELILPSIGKKVFNLSVSGKVLYALPMDAGC